MKSRRISTESTSTNGAVSLALANLVSQTEPKNLRTTAYQRFFRNTDAI